MVSNTYWFPIFRYAFKGKSHTVKEEAHPRKIIKTIIRYHYILIALAMLLDFTVTPAMATGKNPSSGDDKRVQDYKRKIEDVNCRIEAAGKTLRQSTIGYKAQAERKQMELGHRLSSTGVNAKLPPRRP